MAKPAFALGFILMSASCAASRPALSERPSAVHALVFPTRDGCVNTATMRANHDEALKTLGRPMDCQIIDVGTLLKSDPRGGYSTPTVLHWGRDLFGMPEPSLPYDSAT